MGQCAWGNIEPKSPVFSHMVPKIFSTYNLQIGPSRGGRGLALQNQLNCHAAQNAALFGHGVFRLFMGFKSHVTVPVPMVVHRNSLDRAEKVLDLAVLDASLQSLNPHDMRKGAIIIRGPWRHGGRGLHRLGRGSGAVGLGAGPGALLAEAGFHRPARHPAAQVAHPAHGVHPACAHLPHAPHVVLHVLHLLHHVVHLLHHVLGVAVHAAHSTHAGTAAKITEAATITATKVATTHILVAIIVPTPAGVAIAHAHAVAHIAHAVASHTAHPRPRAAAAL